MFVSFSFSRRRESELQIDYLEKNFLNPLKEAERMSSKVILAEKDRRTLQKIHGIIETNALYLAGNNQVAGKLNFHIEGMLLAVINLMIFANQS
jgi:hypothetical protein